MRSKSLCLLGKILISRRVSRKFDREITLLFSAVNTNFPLLKALAGDRFPIPPTKVSKYYLFLCCFLNYGFLGSNRQPLKYGGEEAVRAVLVRPELQVVARIKVNALFS